MKPRQIVVLGLLAATIVAAAAVCIDWLQRRRRGKALPPSASYKVLDPTSDYRPNNPPWLIEAAAWTPDTVPPELRLEPPAVSDFKARVASGAFQPVFGRACREELFALGPEWSYLNHGSYGGTYRLALQAQDWWRQQLEAQPVRFIETGAMAGVVAGLGDAAELLGARFEDVVPVVNATSAVNCVVGSLPALQLGDLLLMTNATYPAVRSTLAKAAAAAGAALLEVQLSIDTMSDADQVVAAFEAALAAGGARVRLAVLDHIISFPPVVLPVARLCSACRRAGVPVLVDGAHAAGALPGLAIPELGADFYTTNLHKWCCTPKGTALLWVAPGWQGRVRPHVVSHGYGLGLRGEFLWQGTQDLTPWLSVPAALAVLRALRAAGAPERNTRLAWEAAAMLGRRWGTQRALGMPATASQGGAAAAEWPPMVAVELPGGLAAGLPPGAAGAAALHRRLRDVHGIEVPCVHVAGLWVRISAQAHNQLSDYERLADAVLGM